MRFVGPLRLDASSDATLPSWWDEFDGSRPVVHVTQGTLANANLGRLMVPTLHALAREDVLVVASTGGRPASDLFDRLAGPLPDNARVAEFLPYDRLLPRTQLMVTNGGYGGVQQALAYGVPLVVAGTTEDKPEVAGRVAWSGAGINLRSGSPSRHRIRRAVRSALWNAEYAAQAKRLQVQIGELGDPLSTIAATLEALVLAGDPAVHVR